MSEDRPTVDLPRFTAKTPKAPEPSAPNSRYSVKRAATEDERSQLVERVAIGPPRALRPATEPGARWRVEVTDDRVTLRGDGVTIELGPDEARRLAETILRGK